MEKKYKNRYDDPYRMLAASIAVRVSIASAKRLMSDKEFIKQTIQAEVREGTDIIGPFSDCITAELISNSKRVVYRDALNELGRFFFEQLDIPRFRKELQGFYREFGIEL